MRVNKVAWVEESIKKGTVCYILAEYGKGCEVGGDTSAVRYSVPAIIRRKLTLFPIH